MTTDASVPRVAPPPPSLVAPLWHTLLLLAILFLLALGGARLQSRPSSEPGVIAQHQGLVPLYISTLVFEWALVGYVWLGIRRRSRMRDLVSGHWSRLADVGRDLVIAILFWGVFEATAWLMGFLLGPDTAKAISILLPQGALEMALWVLVSVSAGFCEEAVFRGYLQRQFHALSRSALIAVLAQAVVFGISHGYQGPKQVVTITVLGLIYGLLAWWRRSLRPGMLAHAWSDVFGGLLSSRL
jgi:membrane protease YdiL (CAAX protease family)